MRRALPSLLRTLALFLASWQAARAGAVSGVDSRRLDLVVRAQPVASGASLARFHAVADGAVSNTAPEAVPQRPGVAPYRPLLDRGAGLAQQGASQGGSASGVERGSMPMAAGNVRTGHLVARPVALWLVGGNQARAPCLTGCAL